MGHLPLHQILARRVIGQEQMMAFLKWEAVLHEIISHFLSAIF